jgi:uncharacterized protein with NRDE domain
MCTVTFYKDKEHVIITSNRDESIRRPLALSPRKIMLPNIQVYCPIDPLHKGTWFAVNRRGNVFVLLNGAGKNHTPNPPYRKSRGLVLLDIADSHDVFEKWRILNLHLIENFTVISYFEGELTQFRWDGIRKSQTRLDETMPHIWSSTTLYDEDTIARRKEWFSDFLVGKEYLVAGEDFFRFHTNTKNEDKNNGLIINRANEMLTKNVTQANIYPNRFSIQHRDLITNQSTILEDVII